MTFTDWINLSYIITLIPVLALLSTLIVALYIRLDAGVRVLLTLASMTLWSVLVFIIWDGTLLTSAGVPEGFGQLGVISAAFLMIVVAPVASINAYNKAEIREKKGDLTVTTFGTKPKFGQPSAYDRYKAELSGRLGTRRRR